MNKTDLAKEMSSRMHVPMRDILLFIKVFEQSLTTFLKEGEPVCLQGFGTFSLWKQTERLGRNPRTGDTCMISPRSSVKFKPGKNLLKDLNGVEE